MNLQLLSLVVCRTPRYSFTDELEEIWSEFEELLAESSKEFYSQLEFSGITGLSKINSKIEFTLWKYVNRSVFRSTPYGRFASFTCLPVIEGKMEVVINKEMLVHAFIDWAVIDNTASQFVEIEKCEWLFVNSSLYTVASEHRYIRFVGGNFEISTVTGFQELDSVLNFCKIKTSKRDLYNFLLETHSLNYTDANNLLEQMLNLQLLHSNICPNIIGDDYFQRMSQLVIPLEKQYLISERKRISGGFDRHSLREVPELILFLSKHLPTQSNVMLDVFRKAFLNKFEQQMVPITIVMDIELGIGYGDLGEGCAKNELIDKIKPKNVEKDFLKSTIPYTRFTRFILDELISNGEINLDEFKERLEDCNTLPNTFSVLFSIFNGKPVIGTIGNNTANCLLGRFSIASSELEKFCVEIANIESEANPDVIFFDVAYQAERQVDNVNRRKKLYQYELPILSWTLDQEPISMNDILVGVRGNDIILWSSKYNKRMLPRIPSAYNYHRSDLAAFRFLCDLQHYQLKTDLNFSVQAVFPGLLYYPRINYKGIIVSPAMWKVPEEILKSEKGNDLTAYTNLIEWLDAKDIRNPFKAGEHDQLLCFDPKKQIDLEAFLIFCEKNKQKEIYISEALIDKMSDVKDEQGKPLVAEFIASYAHREKVYNSYQLNGIIDNQYHLPVPSNFPLNHWLYFEIYCHSIRSNEILCDKIAPYLKENRRNIESWYFIRYEIPSHHIRLRVLLSKKDSGGELISSLSSALESQKLLGWVSEIQIKTYFPEVNRYGSNCIALVEKLFYMDSKYVLSRLSRKCTEEELYIIALNTMSNITSNCINNPDKQLQFTQNMASQFASEFSMKMESFKTINSFYKKFKPSLNNKKYLQVSINNVYRKILSKVLGKCDSENKRQKLAADLIHMHINRLFRTDQRIHEAILYQYFLKAMTTRFALSN